MDRWMDGWMGWDRAMRTRRPQTHWLAHKEDSAPWRSRDRGRVGGLRGACRDGVKAEVTEVT